MTDTVVNSGDVFFGPVNAGDTVEVLAGGEIDSAINSGGTVTVSGGGTNYGAYYTTTESGGVQIIDSGATAIGSAIGDGGVENLVGTGLSETISAGGVQNVSAGGVANDTTIQAGGVQNLYSDPGSSVGANVYGTENVLGGESTSANVYAGGNEVVSQGGTAIATEVQSGGTLTMEGGTATDTTLQQGAIVDITDVMYQAGETAAIKDGKLTLESSNGTVLDQSVSVSGGTGGTFLVTHDPNGGVTITDTVCYLNGTRLLTPTGETRVEDLRIGDVVVTRFSGFQAIKWIGTQTFGADEACSDRDRMPVRIHAGALASGVPARDLFVSPGHSMLVDGTLILAKSLINGITVTQQALPNRLEYFQLDLGAHDCVVAEGAWSETFADGDGLRENFHNVQEFHAMFPDHRPPEHLVPLCAPRPLRGAALGATLLPIVKRASMGLQPGRLRGFVDAVIGDWKLEGWAQDEDHPLTPVNLEVLVGGKVLGTVLACDFRKDLLDALGEGNLSFVFESPIRLRGESLSTLEVRRVGDAAPLVLSRNVQEELNRCSRPIAMKPQLSVVRDRGSVSAQLQLVG